MADDLSRLIVEVRSDGVAQATTRLRGLENQGGRTERSAGQLSTRFERLNQRTERLRRTMFSLQGVLASVGLAFGIRGIAGVIGQFEESLSGVQAVTRGTAAEMRAMEEAARRLGATTRFSAAEAAEGMRFLGQASFDANEIIQAIPATLNLAAAGALDLGRAADIASNVLSQFSLEASQTNEVADTMALAAASANTNVEQLAEALKPVGGIAASVGIEMRTTVAALSAMAEEGRQGSAAGTGLRRVLSGLLNPTAEAARELKAMGLEIESLNPATNDFIGIIEELARANLDASTAFQIFGDRGAPAVITLINQLPQLREFVEAQRENAGVAEETAEIMDDNLVGAARALNSAWQELILQTGDRGLAGAMRTLVDTATGVLRVLAGMTEDLGENERLYRNLATAVEAVATAMAAMVAVRVVSFLATMAAEVVLLTRAMWGLNAAMIANPIGAFTTTAGLAAAAVVVLTADMRRSTGAVNEHADALDNLIDRNDEMTESLRRQMQAYRGLSDEVTGLTIDQQIASLSREIGEMEAEQDRLRAAIEESGQALSDFPLQARRLRELDAQIAATREEMLRLRDEAVSLSQAARTLEGAIKAWGAFFPNVTKAIDDQADSVDEHRQRIEEAIDTLRRQADEAMQVADAQRNGAGAVREVERAIEAANIARELEISQNSELFKEIERFIEVRDQQLELARLIEEQQADELRQVIDLNEGYEDQAFRLQRVAEESARVKNQRMDEEFKKQQEALRDMRREAEQAAREMARPFEQAAEGIQRGFSDAFFDIFREGRLRFQDLASSIKDAFARMLAELAALAIARPIIVPAVTGAAGMLGFGGQAQTQLARQLGGPGLPGGFASGINRFGSRIGFASPGRTVGEIPGIAPGVEMPAQPGAFNTQATLSQFLQAGAIGAFGGNMLARITNMNRTGATAGGGLGAAAGMLLGGPIGGLIGGMGGGFLGGLFGGGGPSNRRQSVALGAGGIDRRFGFTGAKFDQELRDTIDGLGEQVVGFIQGLQEITGERFERELRLDIGRRDPSRVFLDGRIAQRTAATDPEALLGAALRTVAGEFRGLSNIIDRLDFSDIQQALRDIDFAVAAREGRLFERQLTQTEQAVAQLRSGMEEFRQTARRLGLSVRDVERQAREAFERDIQEQILGIRDPEQAAIEEFERGARARLELARDLGADINRVEELHMLERKRIIEQFAQETDEVLRRFLTGLAGPGGALPAQQRLGLAEQQFGAQVTAARAGDLDAQALTRAADSLLRASEDLFARSPQFFERFGFVVRTLQNILGDEVIPGFQTGGSFRVGGSGGPDSQLVAFRATPGEMVDISRPGEASNQDITAMLGEIVRAIRGDGGQVDATLTSGEQLAARIDVLIEEMQGLKDALRREPQRSQAPLRRVGS